MNQTTQLSGPTLGAIAMLLLTGCGTSHSQQAWPGDNWENREPSRVAMNAEKLDALGEYVGGRGCVVRHGYMVHTWGDVAQRRDVASAVKPVYAHFLFRAVERGLLDSVDDYVVQFEPQLAQINAALGHRDRDIRWRHLANQTACYGVSEPPGEAFVYSDFQIRLFADTLFTKVYGKKYSEVDDEVLHSDLADRIGCQDDPTFLAFGREHKPGRLAISVRDFARFGLLYLRKGRWVNKQIIRPEHVTLATRSPLPNSIPRTSAKEADMIPGQRSSGSQAIPDNQSDHLGSYSWAWWTNGVDRDGRRHWPDAPLDTCAAIGHWGPRVLAVMPGLDIVVAWNDAKVRGRDMENGAFRLLAEAVSDRETTTGQIIVDPERPHWLRRKGLGPFYMCGPGDPEGFLYRGTLQPDGTRHGDQMELISKLAATGANCIYLMAVRSHGGDGDATENPFIDNDPAKGLNQKLLDQWETWFRAMDSAGITIFFILYDDSCNVWNTRDNVTPAEAAFVERLASRFQHHDSLIWCIAEEYSEANTAGRVRKLARIIREADERDHVIAVHKLSGLDFSEFADDPNIDQYAIQYNRVGPDELHRALLEAWPTAEGRYSLNMSESADFGTGRAAREKMWACALAGAHVMILDMDIADTAKSDLYDCGRLVRFMQSTDFDTMAPRDELAAGETKYVLANPGQRYILYSSDCRGKMGVRDMTAGHYCARWLDCATGESIFWSRLEIEGGDWLLDKPDEIGDEVAVYLRRATASDR